MFFKRVVLLVTLLIFSFTAFSEDSKQDGFKIGGAMRYNILATNYENG